MARTNSFWESMQRYCHNLSVPLRWKCKQGSIKLVFEPKSGIDPFKVLRNREPAALLEVTSEIQIVVESHHQRDRISARFSPAECVELLGETWPNSETFNRIARAVRERKAYPMPTPEIPGGGGKSMTAQGQTKKDGSHSQDRHH